MAGEAEERILERLQDTVLRNTQERIKRPIFSTQCNITIIGDYLDIIIPLNSKLYTKVVELLIRGVVDLGVKINGSSVHNLLSRSIVNKLGLLIYFGKSI